MFGSRGSADRTTIVLDKSASHKGNSSKEGSVYQSFTPLQELVEAVTEASTSGVVTPVKGAAAKSQLAYMLVPEFVSTPTVNRWATKCIKLSSEQRFRQ
jgi:hypothetical protein